MNVILDFWVEWLLMTGVFALLVFILRSRMKKRSEASGKTEKVPLSFRGRLL
jgi:hypothetical protein